MAASMSEAEIIVLDLRTNQTIAKGWATTMELNPAMGTTKVLQLVFNTGYSVSIYLTPQERAKLISILQENLAAPQPP